MRYYYKPKKRYGRYSLFCFLPLFISAGLIFPAYHFGLRFLYAASFVFLCLSLQIFTVYILSSYEYELDGAVFMIYRRVGKSVKRVFDLDLSFAEELVPYKEAKARIKEKGGPARRFYCTSGCPKKRCRALFYDGGYMLVFAPDEAFARLIKDQIR